jgi:DNA-binding GntR family transcriptional regulator
MSFKKLRAQAGISVVRLGQSFNLGEVSHHCRLFEALDQGKLELARAILRDQLSLSVRRKFLAMRERGRKELAAIDSPIPYDVKEQP